MAQLKDLIVNGKSKLLDDTSVDGQVTATKFIKTGGDSSHLLSANGDSTYHVETTWDGASNEKIPTMAAVQGQISQAGGGTVTQINTTSPISGGPITSTGTISLADSYGDTKNPFGSKTKNRVLASPATYNGAPGFRELVKADIPALDYLSTSGGTVSGQIALTSNNIHGTISADSLVLNDNLYYGGGIFANESDGDFQIYSNASDLVLMSGRGGQPEPLYLVGMPNSGLGHPSELAWYKIPTTDVANTKSTAYTIATQEWTPIKSIDTGWQEIIWAKTPVTDLFSSDGKIVFNNVSALYTAALTGGAAGLYLINHSTGDEDKLINIYTTGNTNELAFEVAASSSPVVINIGQMSSYEFNAKASAIAGGFSEADWTDFLNSLSDYVYNGLYDGSWNAITGSKMYLPGVITKLNNSLIKDFSKVNKTGDTITGNLTFISPDKGIIVGDGCGQLYSDGQDTYLAASTGGLFIEGSSGDNVSISSFSDLYIQSGNTTNSSISGSKVSIDGTTIPANSTLVTTSAASSTANAIPRFADTTGKIIKDSNVTISNVGTITIPSTGKLIANTIAGSSSSISILANNGSYTLAYIDYETDRHAEDAGSRISSYGHFVAYGENDSISVYKPYMDWPSGEDDPNIHAYYFNEGITTVDENASTYYQYAFPLANGTIALDTTSVTLNTYQTITKPKVIRGLDTADGTTQPALLKVLSTATATTGDTNWKGRIICGAENKTFLLGTYNGLCGLGAHSWTSASAGTGAAWENIYINPDGSASVILGGSGWNANDYIVKVNNNGRSTQMQGLVEIGKRETSTTPSVLTASSSYLQITPYYHTGGPWQIRNYDNSSQSWLYINYGTTTGIVRVDHSGNFYANKFYATSDKRLKENFVEYTPEKSILDLPIYKYDYINGTKNQIGCIAQDLQEICPEIVVTDNEGYLRIDENKIVYLLLDEVKKLKQEVNDLKNR